MFHPFAVHGVGCVAVLASTPMGRVGVWRVGPERRAGRGFTPRLSQAPWGWVCAFTLAGLADQRMVTWVWAYGYFRQPRTRPYLLGRYSGRRVANHTGRTESGCSACLHLGESLLHNEQVTGVCVERMRRRVLRPRFFRVPGQRHVIDAGAFALDR